MFRCAILICLLFVFISSSRLEADECFDIIQANAPIPDAEMQLLQPVVESSGSGVLSEYLPLRYTQIIVEVASRHGVSPQLVAALIKAESNFKTKATSSRGARGLMQLTPRTASRYQVAPHELYDPYKNIEAGVKHLKMLIQRYAGNLELAIAAYNTGEFAVDRYGGIPPFRTTRLFVKKVLRHYFASL
jgi:soluble lytic murein transglycosylase-like protein